jgi:photosystem II stability/assembly factor-like uncharacterized protein
VRLLVAICGLALAAPFAGAVVRGPLLLDAVVVGDAIIAVGERGLIQRSTDGGTTWSDIESGVPRTLCAVTFADERTGWAAGHGAIILRTSDGGKSWQHQFTGDDEESPFLDLLALPGGHVIAVGAFGMYYESHDAGATWEQEWILDEDAHLNRISQAADGTLWLAGEFGTLLRSTDQAATWETLTTGDDGSLYGVLPLTNGDLIAYGLRGRIYHSTDNGERWTRSATPGTGLLMTGIELSAARSILVAGQGRTTWTSRDGGRTFTAYGGNSPAIAEFLLSPTGQLLVFGEQGAGPAPGFK